MGIYVNMIITIIHANKVKKAWKKYKEDFKESTKKVRRKYKEKYKEKCVITKRSTKNERDGENISYGIIR